MSTKERTDTTTHRPLWRSIQSDTNNRELLHEIQNLVIVKEKWVHIWWSYIHSVCVSFPRLPITESEQVMYKYALQSAFMVIPCDCRLDAIQLYEKLPPPVHLTRTEMWIWSWQYHNLVRTKLGLLPVTFQDASRNWYTYLSSSSSTLPDGPTGAWTTKTMLLIVILLLLVLVGWLFLIR